MQHHKRAHGSQSSGSNNLDELSSEGDDGRTPTPASDTGVDELLNGAETEPDSATVTGGDVSTNSEQDLKTKLRQLRSIRAELDQDIRSVERVLSIMAGGAP